MSAKKVCNNELVNLKPTRPAKKGKVLITKLKKTDLKTQSNDIDKSLSDLKDIENSEDKENLETGKDRFWTFTLNNYEEEDVKNLNNLECGLDKDIRAIQCSGEKCPSTGTKHLQGLIIFNKQQRSKKTKTVLGNNTVHVERMEASEKANINYTSKPKDFDTDANIFISKGLFDVKQGKKSEITEIIDKIKKGNNVKKAIVGHEEGYIRNHNGLDKFSRMHQKNRTKKTYNVCVYGQSGTGKSTSWVNGFNEDDIYVLRDSPSGGQIWWDGYYQQKMVVIDDFNNNLPLKYMLNLMDCTPMMVDIKGGTAKFNSERLLITTNKSPLEWFPNVDRKSEHYIAMLRRIDECWFHARGQEPVNMTQQLKERIEELKEGPYYDILSGYKNEAYIKMENENKKEEEIILKPLSIVPSNGTHFECDYRLCNYKYNIPCEKHCLKCQHKQSCEFHNQKQYGEIDLELDDDEYTLQA